MATDDDIRKIAKGIGAIIATAGAVGLAKVVADSSKKSEIKNSGSNENDSEYVRTIVEEINHSKDCLLYIIHMNKFLQHVLHTFYISIQ